MSLTSHLKDPKSAIRQFLVAEFPNIRRFLAAARKRARNSDTIRPTVCVPWSVIGMALDYRIRYYFGVSPSHELAAYGGAQLLTETPKYRLGEPRFAYRKAGGSILLIDKKEGREAGMFMSEDDVPVSFDQRISPSEIHRLGRMALDGTADAELDDAPLLNGKYRDFFRSLDALTERIDPVRARLSDSDEDELNRHCVVLALLEEVFRTGLTPHSPLDKDRFESVDAVLGIAELHWLEDVGELSRRFYDVCHHMLTLPSVLNPAFEGSKDVGGADADLIVDGTLIDIKATVKREIKAESLLQLLGYVLLDYSDVHRINGIGLYMARQGVFAEWSLTECMRGLCDGGQPDWEDLRTRFRDLARSGTFV